MVDLIITSAASMTIRTRVFPTASSNDGQKAQRQPSLMREQHAHLYGVAKTSRMHQYQATSNTFAQDVVLLLMELTVSYSKMVWSGT